MKIGIRKPSIKKSIKAKTTGKYKRKLKRMTNPLYGKKGIDWIKNPKRAFKNKIYHKTTISSKKTAKGIGGIFVGFFILCWLLLKWCFLICFYICKYICMALIWLFITIYNGIVTLIEYIINKNREDAPESLDTKTLVSNKEKESPL